MGYGLVAIPRQLWRTADLKGEERALCHRAGAQAEKALAARRHGTPSTPCSFCMCISRSCPAPGTSPCLGARLPALQTWAGPQSRELRRPQHWCGEMRV